MEGRWSCSWNLIGHVEDIKELMATCEVKISHIMREGNKLADHLANYALDFAPIEAHSFGGLDTQRRRIVNSDKLLCPYLRVRVARDFDRRTGGFSKEGRQSLNGYNYI